MVVRANPVNGSYTAAVFTSTSVRTVSGATIARVSACLLCRWWEVRLHGGGGWRGRRRSRRRRGSGRTQRWRTSSFASPGRATSCRASDRRLSRCTGASRKSLYAGGTRVSWNHSFLV